MAYLSNILKRYEPQPQHIVALSRHIYWKEENVHVSNTHFPSHLRNRTIIV